MLLESNFCLVFLQINHRLRALKRASLLVLHYEIDRWNVGNAVELVRKGLFNGARDRYGLGSIFSRVILLEKNALQHFPLLGNLTKQLTLS